MRKNYFEKGTIDGYVVTAIEYYPR